MSVQCENYPTAKNASLVLDPRKKPPFAIGEYVPYYCNAGYDFRDKMSFAIGTNTPVFRCELDGDSAVWKMDTECDPINCGDPGQVDHATRTGSDFSYNGEVSYECKDGYKMTGNKSLFCGASGSWVPSVDKVKCEPPTLQDVQNSANYMIYAFPFLLLSMIMAGKASS